MVRTNPGRRKNDDEPANDDTPKKDPDAAPPVEPGMEQLVADIRNQGVFAEMEQEIQELRERRRFLRANNAQQGKVIEAFQIEVAKVPALEAKVKELELKLEAKGVVVDAKAEGKKRVKL